MIYFLPMAIEGKGDWITLDGETIGRIYKSASMYNPHTYAIKLQRKYRKADSQLRYLYATKELAQSAVLSALGDL